MTFFHSSIAGHNMLLGESNAKTKRLGWLALQVWYLVY